MKFRKLTALALLMCGALAGYPASRAAAAEGVQIIQYVVSSGAPQSSSASFNAAGTVGQPAIQTGTSENYQTDPGIWGQTPDPDDCCVSRGDIDRSGGDPDIGDLIRLVEYMFQFGPEPFCMSEADIDGSGGDPDIGDLIVLVEFMFQGGTNLVPCGYEAGGSSKVASEQPEFRVNYSFADGFTSISLTSPVPLRGVQLELESADLADPISLVGDNLDLVYGHNGEITRVGILDLDGGETMPAGSFKVVKLEGDWEVVSAILADTDAQAIVPVIGDRAKIGQLPASFSLNQNYPNPFNPSTTIAFALPEAAEVRLEIFNLLGRKVATLTEGELPAGHHSVVWEGRNSSGSTVATGVYFYRLDAGSFSETKKMLLLK